MKGRVRKFRQCYNKTFGKFEKTKDVDYICNVNCVIEHIEYLTRRHDCVVLPSFGAFIAHYIPAFYDESAKVMYPPVREISFNASVVHDDGLLSSSVARRENICFEKASLRVSQEIEAMKHQLKNDREITLGHLGSLKWQSDGAPLFEPYSQAQSGSMSFFKPLELNPVIERARTAAKQIDRHVRRKSRISRIGRNFMKAAATVAALIGAGLVLSTPMVSDRQDNLASFTSSPTESSQTALIPRLHDTGDLSLNIFIPKETENSSGKDVSENEPLPSCRDLSELHCDPTDKYCLVIASLPNLSQAEKYIAESSETGLGLLEQDGKFRVYIATGRSSDEAYSQRMIGSIANDYPDAWVCRRR